MRNSTISGCLLALVCAAASAHALAPASDSAEASAPEAQPSPDPRAATLQASLAGTGNAYPTPALFVKRWNLLTLWAPEARITEFTAQGHEDEPHPIAELDRFDFAAAGTTHLRIGATGRSVDYATARGDSATPDAMKRNVYSVSVDAGRKKEIGQLCLWTIRSAKSAFTVHSAVELFAAAARSVPTGDAANRGKRADAEGITLTLRNAPGPTCEVGEAKR